MDDHMIDYELLDWYLEMSKDDNMINSEFWKKI